MTSVAQLMRAEIFGGGVKGRQWGIRQEVTSGKKERWRGTALFWSCKSWWQHIAKTSTLWVPLWVNSAKEGWGLRGVLGLTGKCLPWGLYLGLVFRETWPKKGHTHTQPQMELKMACYDPGWIWGGHKKVIQGTQQNSPICKYQFTKFWWSKI